MNIQSPVVDHETRGGSLTLSPPLLGKHPAPIRLKGIERLLLPQVPLAKFTSFRVGGAAELFFAPRNLEELRAGFYWAEIHQVPTTLLGAGTNLLVSDRGLPGLVICTRYLRFLQFDAEAGQVIAAAGEPIARLAWYAAERGWSGLEWAAGIPGTVGGAVVMNAGAHQRCAADVFMDAQVLANDNTLQILRQADLGFAYRTSSLQATSRLITQASFQLEPGHEPQQVLAETRRYLKHRHTTQPYHLPSCGSVFRNPASHAAGWLIEQTGLKGHQIGGAQVAQRHANFILNLGGATATDIFNLIQHVQEQVERQWSLLLHPEVKMLGEF
ncbi:MAG: UDP-N-acetylmuramate dehydrogenase [Synechococcales bacterium]|nr:UDP-N-acetylmuramate dehydrogenase [Synechococcales bacterium]